MLKRFIVAVLGLSLFTSAAYADEVIEHRDEPMSTVGIVARDGIYGGIAGAAVGGGIMLIQDHGWDGRTMAISAGVGLLAGIGLGIFDAAAQHPAMHSDAAPVDARPIERISVKESGLPAAFALPVGGSF